LDQIIETHLRIHLGVAAPVRIAESMQTEDGDADRVGMFRSFFSRNYDKLFLGSESFAESVLLQRFWSEDRRAGQSGLVMIDVGAGEYRGKHNVCQAMVFARELSCESGIRVVAFEAQQSVLERTYAATGANRFPCVRWEGVAVSDRSGNFTLYGQDNFASLLKNHWHDRQKPTAATVETTTLDSYTSKEGIFKIDYLKIDTEGNDPRVLQGMQRLLRTGSVGILILEHSSHWNEYYNAVWKSGKEKPGRNSSQLQRELDMKSVVELMEDLGYEAFVLGVYNHESLLMPLTGVFWDDTYDVCLGRFCFEDILFVSRRHPYYARVESMVIATNDLVRRLGSVS
jgi:FkbM family methyltransferase